MNKKWFYRTLLSYIPVFFIVTSLLFFIFFQTLNQESKKEAAKANQFLAEQALNTIDSTLKSIDQKVTFDILSNSDFSYFLSPEEEIAGRSIRMVNTIHKLMVTNPIIDSIYIVRFEDSLVLTNSTSFNLNQFPDQPFIEEMRANPSNRWSGRRSYEEFSQSGSRQVISLTRGIPIHTREQGMLVLNVRTDSLLPLMNDMYNPEISYVHWLDRQNYDLFADPGTESAVKRSAGEASTEVYAEVISDYTGWTVQTGLIHGNTIRFVLSLYNIWIVLGIMLVMAGIGWMIYVTKKNYEPIELIVSRIQSFSRRKKQELPGFSDGNEFNYIENALENMFEQSILFEQRYAADLNVKKKFFFYELLEGTRQISTEDWVQEMDAFELPQTFGKQLVFVIEIDKYNAIKDKYSDRDRSLLKFALTSALQEIAQLHKANIWTLWKTGDQLSGAWQLPPGEESESDGTDNPFHPDRALETLREWVEKHLKFTITVGVGDIVDHPDSLQDSYKEALDAIGFKNVLGGNRVIRRSEIVTTKGELYEHLQLIYSIIQAYRVTDDKWKTDLRELFGEIRSNLLTRVDTESLASFLIYHLNLTMDGMAPVFGEKWSQETMPRLQQLLSSFETVDELEEHFLAELDSFAEQLNRLRESRNHHSVIGEVRSYMENHFANPDLSLDLLGETFGLNGKYLSKLFKEEYGVKFVDFLIDLRVRYAKKLLLDTSLPVQTIAEKSGYLNPISFNRVFKKATGMSPGDFRRQNEKS